MAVTFRCNAHCVMCNVWKRRQADAIQPEHMRKLPPALRTVNLTGGEPFLRADLPDFVREVRARCRRAVITLSTNAYLPDRIIEMMGTIRRIDPRVRLAVSLDGIGAAHDRIRGDEGAFDRAVGLVGRLAADGFAGLRLGMTVCSLNADQFDGVAALARRHGLELGVVAAHAARTHLDVDAVPPGSMPPCLDEQFQHALSRWLRSWRPKQWLRAHFAYHTWRRLRGRTWPFRCRAAEDFFFVQADGTVYGCSVAGRALGSLIDRSWAEIWGSPEADEARRSAARCPQACWMICTARGVYRSRAAWVVGWILKGKLLAHLGRLRLGGGGAS